MRSRKQENVQDLSNTIKSKRWIVKMSTSQTPGCRNEDFHKNAPEQAEELSSRTQNVESNPQIENRCWLQALIESQLSAERGTQKRR